MSAAVRRLRHVRWSHHGLAPPPAVPQRRVVVTGLGCVTPLGCGTQLAWEALLRGASGVRLLTAPEDGSAAVLDSLAVRFAAKVPRGTAAGQLDWEKWSSAGQVAPFVAFALAAAQEALYDSRLALDDRLRAATGVSIGSGMGHVADIAQVGALLAAGQPRKVSPHFVPRILVNMAAGHVSMSHGLTGPLCAPATACASGAHALGEAFRLIRGGDATAMLAGGTEACVDAVALTGFARARALATLDGGSPEGACRPFDAHRRGFVLAEGAAVLVLEEYEHARARGARMYAEMRGCGLAADAHHVTAPPPDGRGALAAMRAALAQAGLEPGQVGHVNAHATGTPLGDGIEARAVAQLFGGEEADRSQGVGEVPPLLLSSTKGATGHLLGAAGALEAVFAVMTLHTRMVPPTLNLSQQDVLPKDQGTDAGRRRIHLVAGSPVAVPGLVAVLSNSFGFGGTNASVCFTQPPPP
jgi:3-oxoacyl-[acyl-carrier-protein] synthase II